MRKRLLISLAVLAAVFVGGYVALWMTAPGPGPTPGNAEAIRLGMTMQEVEGLLGGPGENAYTVALPAGAFTKSWGIQCSAPYSVSVVFNHHGEAIDKAEWHPGDPPSPSLLDRLRRSLGL